MMSGTSSVSSCPALSRASTSSFQTGKKDVDGRDKPGHDEKPLNSLPMPSPRLTVWYNTRCPVCDAGIDWQRNKLLAALRAGTLEFRDINQQPDALSAYGAGIDDIRRRLHATDEEGRLIVGADVALALWRLTPGEGWLAALLGNPVTLPVTRFVYDRFADVLFAWNRRNGRW
jgi:predicted DCC family thiol-disulfide oxidoreductase YuxK